MPTRFTTTATLLSLALPFAPGGAQQARSSIAVSGGVATDQRGVRSSAMSLAPSLTLQDTRSALHLGGSATRFATAVWSLGATGALATRAPVGDHAAFTLDASASGARLTGGASGTFASAELLPALELRAGILTLFGGGRAAAGRATQPALTSGTAPLFGGPTRPSDVAITAAGAGPLFGAALSFSAPDGGQLRLGAREDRLRVDGTAAVDRTVTAHATQARLSLQASVGQRTGSSRESFGGGSISVGLSQDLSLEVGAGRYARNLVLGTPGGRYANAGLMMRLGSATTRALPVPAGAGPSRPGATRLAIRAREARRVEVAGDFTDWKFVAATRAANGVWYADLRIPPGQYRYAFRIDGTEWRVPDGATAVDDGFGGKSAWITVPDRSRQ